MKRLWELDLHVTPFFSEFHVVSVCGYTVYQGLTDAREVLLGPATYYIRDVFLDCYCKGTVFAC